MRILCLTISSLLVPAIAFAHSGTVFRAFAGWLPFALPFLLAALAAARKLLQKFLRQKK